MWGRVEGDIFELRLIAIATLRHCAIKRYRTLHHNESDVDLYDSTSASDKSEVRTSL